MEWIKIFNRPGEAKDRLKESQPQLVVVGSLRICLVRIGDNFFAVGDKCSHNGESLSKGKVNFIGEVVCPWHGYRFNLLSGRCAESAADIPIYPTKESVEGFFIRI
jgi:3-phenylpropionate/trans-cinnamate dioxygenase ferredoxin subunit